ncbi:MarR family winged helix-turn-helix transcriptional regulator [Clostridium swellfunianum]|uniref:MarR family winged helix-turn-helix transcriptional regulator n=1 Tax=Clostridium swellfunianum TaxID=1367462 RepID=UPI00202F6FE4|nr:MarR family winged helix-turn-helix transcriptional regulator [Clostridium swellfunianum]MCM0651006.1 MarR family winged helix-turn-helix transcriptional regulator [Clostridium swellfunianum]
MLVNRLIEMNFDENKKYKDWFGKPFNINDQIISLKKEEKIVLYYLYKYGESPMGDITSSFGFAHSTTNYVVKNLEAKELVSVNPSQNDNRVRLINLTPKGHDLLILLMDHLEKISLKIISDLFPIICSNLKNELTDEEEKVLDKLLTKIHTSIKNIE